MERDYYSILGVNRFASRQAIKRAYRARIRETHPDLHPCDGFASDRARDVIEAYRVLHDPISRRRYDLSRGGIATPTVVPVYACDTPCPLWLTRFVAILLFFAVSAALFYAVAAFVSDDTPVFRPSLGIVQPAYEETAAHYGSPPSVQTRLRADAMCSSTNLPPR